MFVVGLTGGIASGKSTVAKMFMELGCPVIDADLVAKEVVKRGKPAWKRIRRTFGDQVLTETGELNRAKLGEIIFNDASKRGLLNSITHPEIRREMVKQLFFLAIKGFRFAILDIPLLYEACPRKLVSYMSHTVVVHCPEEAQLERLMNRNSYSLAEAASRLASQMSLEEKCRLANHVIDNSGDVARTRQRVEELYGIFKQDRAYIKVRLLVGVLIVLWTMLLYAVARVILFR